MKEQSRFGHWLATRKKRLEKAVTIESAFLTSRYFRYIFYRLRLFFFNSLGGFILHALELFLVFKFMDEKWLFATLVVSTVKLILQGAWWGALEQMRSEIRLFREETRSHLIPKLISRWLSGSCYVAVGTFLFALAAVSASLVFGSEPLSAFHFYVLATALTASVGFVVRTYHSGAFALRRVYRPAISIIGVRVMGFLLTLLLFPLFPEMALPLVLLLNGSLGLYLTFHFSHRAHKALKIRGLEFNLKRRFVWRGFFKKLDSNFYQASLASALMRLDAKVVIFLLYTLRQDKQAYKLFLFFYLLRPVIQMAHEWAGLFYFDAVKLDLNSFRNLAKKFEASVLGTAALMSGLCLTATAGIALALNLSLEPMLYASLACFYLSYSFLSYVQIRAFSKKLFKPVIFSSSAVAVCLMIVFSFGFPLEVCFLAFSLVLLGAYTVLEFFDRFQVRKALFDSFLSLPVWIQKAKAYRAAPVRMCWLTFLDKKGTPSNLPLTPRQRLRLLKQMKSLTGITLVKGRTLMWLADGSLDQKAQMIPLFELFGAFIKDFSFTEVHETSKAAIEEGFSKGPMASLLKERPALKDEKDLIGLFKKTFPRRGEGIVLNLKNRQSLGSQSYAFKQREREILRGVQDYCHDPFAPRRSRDFETTGFCHKDNLNLVFITPSYGAKDKKIFWKKAVTRFNVIYNLKN